MQAEYNVMEVSAVATANSLFDVVECLRRKDILINKA